LAKIQGATFNQQYMERNGLVRLHIVPGSGWNRILQNPDLGKENTTIKLGNDS
jgi:hypothetical protein